MNCRGGGHGFRNDGRDRIGTFMEYCLLDRLCAQRVALRVRQTIFAAVTVVPRSLYGTRCQRLEKLAVEVVAHAADAHREVSGAVIRTVSADDLRALAIPV